MEGVAGMAESWGLEWSVFVMMRTYGAVESDGGGSRNDRVFGSGVFGMLEANSGMVAG